MNFLDLPTDDIDIWTWQYILPREPETDVWSNFYSGTYSVVDGSQVEDVSPARFARIDALFADSPEGYGSNDIALLVELADSGWVTCMAWSDTTGWDCRSDVQWKWAPTRELAISQGLDREARQKLGLSLPEDAR